MADGRAASAANPIQRIRRDATAATATIGHHARRIAAASCVAPRRWPVIARRTAACGASGNRRASASELPAASAAAETG